MNKILTTASRPQNSSARVQDVGVVNVAVKAWELPVTGLADVLVDGVRAFSNGVNAIADRIGHWFEQRRTFAELDALDDRMLADIGIVRSDIGNIVETGVQPVRGVAISVHANDETAAGRDPRLAA